ncbi:hypothetical protein PPGU19_086670 (plasmid) [Paraburkholderia sp. PGU19]|nr:hypothetical protein PPGU19_086670 [Paraburkholderia sp. PGU19]
MSSSSRWVSRYGQEFDVEAGPIVDAYVVLLTLRADLASQSERLLGQNHIESDDNACKEI